VTTPSSGIQVNRLGGSELGAPATTSSGIQVNLLGGSERDAPATTSSGTPTDRNTFSPRRQSSQESDRARVLAERRSQQNREQLAGVVTTPASGIQVNLLGGSELGAPATTSSGIQVNLLGGSERDAPATPAENVLGGSELGAPTIAAAAREMVERRIDQLRQVRDDFEVSIVEARNYQFSGSVIPHRSVLQAEEKVSSLRQFVTASSPYAFGTDTLNTTEGLSAEYDVDEHEGMNFLNFRYLGIHYANSTYRSVGIHYVVTGSDPKDHYGMFNRWEAK